MANVQSAASRSTASDEQNNNNNNNNDNQKPLSNSQGANKKRPSVQSNLSGQGNCSSLSSSSNSNSNSNSNDDSNDQDEAQTRMSNAEYEHIRNTTLLFFLDRLYLASQEGKEARTLHELSCLFGTKEFTKEMRHIVGASRNGLKKFLQSYPSLFQIEDDKVFLTQLKQDTRVSQRDYNKEAVEYFTQKLLQFGTSLVPIRNLFGYRSQASQEVRHVSGKNSRDFKRFLKQNEDVFEILADEHVVLKSALRELESQGQTSLSLQQSLQPVPADDAITMDPYLNKQFAHLVEDCIKKMMQLSPGANTAHLDTNEPEPGACEFKVGLEELHKKILSHCQNERFLKMVKTLEDLRVFLRMHPKLFKRLKCDDQSGGEFVSLASEGERRELESQAHPSLVQRQPSILGSALDQTRNSKTMPKQSNQVEPEQINQFASLPSVTTQSTSNSTTRKHQQQQQPQPQQEQQPQLQSNTSSPQTAAAAREDTPQERSKQRPAQSLTSNGHRSSNLSSLSASHQLRANAPPFVPSTRPSPTQSMAAAYQPYHHHHHHHQQAHQAVHRQNSSLANQSDYRSPSSSATINIGQKQPPPVPLQRSVSNLNSSMQRTGYQHHQDTQAPYHHQGNKRMHEPSQAAAPIDQRNAIRNYLLKGNQSHNLNWARPSSTAAAPLTNQPASLDSQQAYHPYHRPPPQAQAQASQEDLRARTIDIVREASSIISKIMTTTDAVAFDCKGYNLGFDGQITLIQFGFLPSKQVDPIQLASSMSKRFAAASTNDNNQEQSEDNNAKTKPEVCVFDLITNPELAYCLKPLLESDKIVKIVHDVRNKSNALYVQFKIILNNVFDTQVANLVIQQQDTGKPAYKSRYISMSKLCEIYGGEDLVRYRNLIKIKTSSRAGGGQLSSLKNSNGFSSGSSSSKDVNYWRVRPLSRPMIFEATMDVYCLIGGIYQNLKAKIKPEYKPLFDQLNLEGVLARIKPEEIRSAKKERKIDLEVIDLKRKLYSDSTGPVVLSNREIRLLRHIDLTDEVRQKIQQCKKVAKKLERLDMKAALIKQQQQQMQLNGEDRAALMSLNSQLSSTVSNEDNDEDNDENEAAAGRRRAPTSSQHHQQASDNILNGNHSSPGVSDEQRQLQAKLEEFNATGLMMDSSMFDELQAKMVESSSLLESLEDEDEEEAQLSSGHHSHNGSSINDCCRCQCHNRSSLDAASQAIEMKDTLAKAETPKEVAEAPAEKTHQIGGPKEEASSSDTPIPQPVEEEAEQVPQAKSPAAQDDKSKKETNQISDFTSSDTPKQPQQQDDATAQVLVLERQEVDKEAKISQTEDDSDDSKSSAACDMAVQCDLLN